MDIRDMTHLSGDKNYQAEIISYADSVWYLVALINRDDHFIDVVQDENGRAIRFKSIAQAKDWFRDLGFSRIGLRMETPYDECFGEKAQAVTIPIPLSH